MTNFTSPNDYIYLGDERIADIQGGAVSYYFPDHIGSTALMTNGNGNELSGWGNHAYTAFGEDWGGSVSERRRFTGKERDPNTGLDYFEARYNSSSLGRFMTPDALQGTIANPQTLNRFVYVTDNPLRFTDPTGMVRLAPMGQGKVPPPIILHGGLRLHCGFPGCRRPGIAVKWYINLFQRVHNYFSGHGWKTNDELFKVTVTQTILGVVRGGTLTRYMGPGEAEAAKSTGQIPNTDAAGNPRPTHFTRDEPTNDPQAAQTKYELPATLTHRATVPEDSVPNTRFQ